MKAANSRKTLKGRKTLQVDDISNLKDTLKSELSTEVRCQNVAHTKQLSKQLSEWHKEQNIAVNKLARAQQKMFRNLIKVENDKRRIQRQTYINRQEEMRQTLRETARKQRDEAMKKSMESMLSLAIGNNTAEDTYAVKMVKTKKALRPLPTIKKSSKLGELTFEAEPIALLDDTTYPMPSYHQSPDVAIIRHKRKRRTDRRSSLDAARETKRPTQQYIDMAKSVEKHPPINVTKSKVLPSISRNSDAFRNLDGKVYRQKSDLDIINAVSLANAESLSSSDDHGDVPGGSVVDTLPGTSSGSGGIDHRLTTPYFTKHKSQERQSTLEDGSHEEHEHEEDTEAVESVKKDNEKTIEKDGSRSDAHKLTTDDNAETPDAREGNIEPTEVRPEGTRVKNTSDATDSPQSNVDSSSMKPIIESENSRTPRDQTVTYETVPSPTDHLGVMADQSLNSNQVLPPIGGSGGGDGSNHLQNIATAEGGENAAGKSSRTSRRRRMSSTGTENSNNTTTTSSSQNVKKKAKNTKQKQRRERQSLVEDMKRYQVGIAERPPKIPDYEAPLVESVVKYTKTSQGSFVSSDVKVKPTKDSFKLPSKKSEYLLDKALKYERGRVGHQQSRLDQFYGNVDECIDRSKRSTYVPKPVEPRRKSHLPPTKLEPTIQSRTFGVSLEGYHIGKDVHDVGNTRYLRFYGKALPETPNTAEFSGAFSTKERLSSWGQSKSLSSYARPSLAYP